MRIASVRRANSAVVKVGLHPNDQGAEPYSVRMRFRAQAYDHNTNDLAADLGDWDSKNEAQSACLSHADEELSWEQRWPALVEAHTEAYWYRIVIYQD
jgi:hypothetical protein